jgi:ABC-type antimicrobial peptide transport system permease subunit
MAIRNLWRRKLRTLLTLVGITIGIAVVVTLSMLAEGIAGQISALMSAGGAEITLMQAGIADMQFSSLDQSEARVLAEMPEVEWVSGLLLQIVPIEQRPYFVVMGIDPQAESFRHFRLIEGQAWQREDDILLGRMAATFLEVAPGEDFSVAGETFRVAGIYETGVGMEDAAGVISLDAAQRLFRKPDLVNFFQVKLSPESLDEIDTVTERIEDNLPEMVAYRSSDFAENTPDIQTLQSLAGIVSLIGLVAGALAITNTMLMSVFERTREIGTLRALGWRKRRVLGMILAESLLLGLAGGVAGIGVGVGLMALIAGSPALSGVVLLRPTPEVLMLGLTVALMLAGLGGLYPAWRASWLQPAEALHYE